MDTSDTDSLNSENGSTEFEYSTDTETENSLSLMEELLELNDSAEEEENDSDDDDYVTMSSNNSSSTDDGVEDVEIDVETVDNVSEEEDEEEEEREEEEEDDEEVAVLSILEEPSTPPRNNHHVPQIHNAILSPESEGQTCTICFEVWTNSGNHRLSSLNCGHVFGYACIKKWLSRKDARCPSCNNKAKCSDIRVIFANSLTALDTAERDRALDDLQKEKEGRRRAELETVQQRLQLQLQEQELNRLRQLLDEKKFIESIKVQHTPRENTKPIFSFDRAINVCEAGESRVMTYANYSNFLIVSKQLKGVQNYGYTQLNGYLNWSSQSELVCHSKQIRDLAFNPLRPDGMLLTASTDKSLCLSNVYNNNIAQRYQVEAPAWSCTWSRVNASHFYAGLQNGKVLMFDTRNTKTHVGQFSPSNGAHHPNISVVYIDPQPGFPFSSGGLLVGQMSQIYFIEFMPNGFKEHILPIKGNLSALTFDYKTRQILASFRPSSQNLRVQHKLCKLISENRSLNPAVIDNVCSCDLTHTFEGGTKMSRLSRSAFIPNLNKDLGLLACVGDESKNALVVWNIETAEIALELQLPSLTDICLVGNGDKQQLACLTNKCVSFYNCAI